MSRSGGRDLNANLILLGKWPSSLLETLGDLVSKETVCCVGGKVKH